MTDTLNTSELKRLTLPDFSGGINTANPSTDIQDNEAVDILNFEYDDANNLVTRNGVLRAPDAVVARWDSALWDVDVWGVANSEPGSRLTSLHYFENDTGFVGILFTAGTKLYSMSLDGLTITDITGSLVLPNDTFWQWVTYNNIAIGVNKATSGSNPVKVTGPSPGTAAALGGSPPKGKYVEVWNSRVWIVDAANRNSIQASNLGDPETWNTDGSTNASHGFIIDIDKGDGDKLTGIKAFKERLILFKSKLIYAISATLLPVTDPDNLSVDIFSKNVGCISPYSIQPLLDDIVFLGEGGATSLQAAFITADFKSALLSRRIKELTSLLKTTDEIPSFVLEDMSQYLISPPPVTSETALQNAFVLDYKNITQQQTRWVRFDQLLAGTAYTSFLNSEGRRVYVIGCKEGSRFFPGFYIPKAATKTFRDALNPYTKNVTTKAFGFNINLILKLFKYWAVSVELLTNSLQVSIKYFFNTKNTVSGSQSFNLTAASTGSMYDVSLYDVDHYDASTQAEQTIRREFLRNSAGRRAKNVQFQITNSQVDQGFILNQFDVGYFLLSEKHDEDI